MARSTDLTKGNITRGLWGFALPLMLGNVLQQLYNLVDTWVVGRYVGDNALAAVGSSYTLMTFLTSVIIGLCLGSSSFVSMAYGRKDVKAIRNGIFLSSSMIGAIAVVIMALFYILVDKIILLLQVPYEIAGVIHKGYHSDAARTYGIGKISDEAAKLIEVTRQSFFEGIKYAKEGCHLYEISNAIAQYNESFGYGVIRDLVGHGIGTELHEEPEIPNFRQDRRGIRLYEGMTLAIEPMVSAGDYKVRWLDDNWTASTFDHSLSAHYENTVLVTKAGPEILSLVE